MLDKNIDDINELEVLPWNDNFETGLPEVDEQHKVIVQLLNKLASTLIHDKPIDVTEAFEELAAYADFHFEAEEAIWSEYFGDDSWFVSHRHSHASFLPKVLELKEKDADKPLHDVVEDIVKFLIRWLAVHIIDDDKKLAAAILEMHEGASLAEAKAITERKMSSSVSILTETVMAMYEGLASRTLSLLRERHARLKVEAELLETNKRLETLSITDQLTGLYNRRHFEEVFYNEMKRARRNSVSLYLIMFDLDHFKSLNDTYGHSAGDQALRSVGECLQRICKRPADFAFRLGGEEFAVIASGDPSKSCALLAEMIRAGIEELNIPNVDSLSGDVLTASLGAVTITPDKSTAKLDVHLKTADERLYLAKSQGRNCFVVDG
jgi:diguanylate cyclase (GGDEF)-like protein/hemerythrin-like metal-binding protein